MSDHDQRVRDFLTAATLERRDIDRFLDVNEPNWARFDPDLGYVPNSSRVVDGADGATSTYRYGRQGERLMINGEQGVNRRLLFAAMAGLWPWGQGRIEMPDQTDTLFIAQHGYLPAGTLREIMAYPRAPQRFAD